jgi:hypothetical protein
MTEDQLVEHALRPPDEWVDTEAQSQLRECLTNILTGHNEIDTIIIAGEVIAVMRDHLMSGTAVVRRSATRAARENGMSSQDIAKDTGQTAATVARLLTESRPYV